MDTEHLRLMYDLMARVGVPCHVHVSEDLAQVNFLMRDGKPQYLNMFAKEGDRWMDVQFWHDGKHRISFMQVTADGPITGQGPSRLHGWVYPTPFYDIDSMWPALEVQSKQDFGPRPGL